MTKMKLYWEFRRNVINFADDKTERLKFRKIEKTQHVPILKLNEISHLQPCRIETCEFL